MALFKAVRRSVISFSSRAGRSTGSFIRTAWPLWPALHP
jgi:hypothetical protein